MTDIKALQGTEQAQFWDDFRAVMGGPDGLMTYRYFGPRSERIGDGLCRGSMRLRSDHRRRGSVEASPLVILVADTLGVIGDAICVPAPTQMALDVVDDAAGVEQVVCLAEFVHHGRTQLFAKAKIVDASDEGRLLAVYRDSAVVMGPAPPDGYERVDPGPGVADDGSGLPPLWQAFGAEQRGAEFVLPVLTGRLGSTSGSLHHGPIHIVLEAAAAAAAATAAGSERVGVRHWHVTFTARGKSGPFASRTRLVGRGSTEITVDSDLWDEADGRLVASATGVFSIRE
jgi:acyl-coenzyme A thioesterase PaaI-like protein